MKFIFLPNNVVGDWVSAPSLFLFKKCLPNSSFGVSMDKTVISIDKFYILV